MAVNSIHWFRKGLRLHDNPALLEAVKGADTLRCVYFLDPWFAGASNLGVNRWRFLLQSLEDLDCSLRKLNSRLFVIRGQPANIFPRLFKEWNVSRLTFECDSEPFGKERDAAIKKLASEAGVEVNVKISHTLYDLDKIIELNGGQTPLTYKRFQTLVSTMSPPEPPVEPLTKELMKNCVTPVSENHRERYGVPLLEELGFDTEGLAPAVWPGGESEALTRMDRHLGPESAAVWQENFERPKMNSSPLLASPLGLSPYLRFGCLSCRMYYYKLTELYKKVKKNENPSISLYDKILWREFFYTAATNNPRFDRMEGNPFCIRIPWDKNAEALAKWAEAKTGFPWIDAIMTQLRQEGWIHHLARHAVACFLTRGDLWISWEEGMKVFEELLLDADWSVNAGSWLCHSCSSFFQQFFHCYCPVGFGRRIDPNGDFIRRYLPVLRDFPAKFIYDPWNAPEDVQIAAKCVIGVDYPKPMVNHAAASRLNIERMRQIYQQLSRYRGLSLLATVPSNHMEEMDVNETRGAAAPPTRRRTHRVGREQRGGHEQPGLSGAKHQHALGHRTLPYTTQSNQTGHAHAFAVPQQPGRLTWPAWGGTGKREREAEHDCCHGDNGPTSTLKVQRQDDERREVQEGVSFSSRAPPTDGFA
ncbi:cryptochrome-1-like isoform X2 [Myxocyprinus asiaticus]|uniref:cryptochrome-1-like isoform X2 n=1 Tax=Myxocyprinus asiaticus TaxID=70543 RepID=UPI002222FD0F|nr:cryptochrome-1-like isoform X2 [Myxocyprinus asiaticus]